MVIVFGLNLGSKISLEIIQNEVGNHAIGKKNCIDQCLYKARQQLMDRNKANSGSMVLGFTNNKSLASSSSSAMNKNEGK